MPNTMRRLSIRKILFVVVPFFLAISAVVYWQVGGFKEAEVTLVEVEGKYTLVGKEYVGTLKHPALQNLLDEVGRRWESGELPGVLTVAVLKEPETDKDTVQQFIGVLLPADTVLQTLPAGYELMEVPAVSAIRVKLDAHSSVWPSPDKLRDKAEAFAREKGYTIQPDLLFEKYYGPRRLEVELPLVLPTSAQ